METDMKEKLAQSMHNLEAIIHNPYVEEFKRNQAQHMLDIVAEQYLRLINEDIYEHE